jgi:thiopurine S-methyltransferase
MKKEFWLDRWENRQIGFHQADTNPYLLTHWPKAVEGELNRVFVPLCGKSKDLIWLSDQGYEVVAVEFSQMAVEEFFQEQELGYELSSLGELNVYRSENITIYQGDFFDLSKEVIGAISIVFDRASLIALPEDLRVRYCKHLYELIDAADIYLICMEYNQEKMQGPPFSVSELEVQRHYSTSYQIKKLETVDLLATSPQFKERDMESLDEKVYKLLPIEPS